MITPNQALSLADVDVRGGSTAGGMLQTSQRIGNAIGAAVISAVFYAAVSAPPGADREATYGHAYGLALGVSVLFAFGAIALALRSLRHGHPLWRSAARREPGDPSPAPGAAPAGSGPRRTGAGWRR